MAAQTVFRRYELKYMLTRQQYADLLQTMQPYMQPDHYGVTTIRNIYFDTDSYRLIRRSIEKPIYKEKLRIRSYDQATNDSAVFVELKKKYEDVVYKRRVMLSAAESMAWLLRQTERPVDSQICREIDYFADFYGPLRPAVFLSYQRQAYYAVDGSDFRVTFDWDILCRRDKIDLREPAYGQAILPADKILLELKCVGGMPLWMSEFLSRERIYKTSFSKYGTAYQKLIFPDQYPVTQKERISNGSTF